jgi:cbb3-type cytochrome oxidase subunit 1
MATNSAYKEWATQTLSASMSMLLVVSSSSSSIVVVAESRGQSEHKMKLIKLGIRILRVYAFSTVLCDVYIIDNSRWEDR